jgi:steroid 5-alpha reductase family enzyme
MLEGIVPGFVQNLWATGAVLLICVVALWLLSIRLKDISIIDIFWGPGFGVVALTGYALSAGHGFDDRRLLVTALTVLWAVRLGGYLWWRNHGKGEDPRYTVAYRNRFPQHLHWHTLTRVYLLQGFLVWLISMPVQFAQYLIEPEFGLATYIGVALWLIGFTFEAVSDWQLARFKANPTNRGRVLDHGLWRYSRHPNYFGNACLWWGLWLLACDHPLGFATVFAPVLMTHFLLNVTGKRLLEKRMSRAKPEYADYIQRTPGFFPWFPRRS